MYKLFVGTEEWVVKPKSSTFPAMSNGSNNKKSNNEFPFHLWWHNRCFNCKDFHLLSNCPLPRNPDNIQRNMQARQQEITNKNVTPEQLQAYIQANPMRPPNSQRTNTTRNGRSSNNNTSSGSGRVSPWRAPRVGEPVRKVINGAPHTWDPNRVNNNGRLGFWVKDGPDSGNGTGMTAAAGANQNQVPTQVPSHVPTGNTTPGPAPTQSPAQGNNTGGGNQDDDLSQASGLTDAEVNRRVSQWTALARQRAFNAQHPSLDFP